MLWQMVKRHFALDKHLTDENHDRVLCAEFPISTYFPFQSEPPSGHGHDDGGFGLAKPCWLESYQQSRVYLPTS